MSWYEAWFDSDLYELVYDSRDERDAVRLADLIERVARPRPGTEILDVGTGRGRHARVLARRGYCVTGLDLSPNALAVARARAEAEGLGPDRLTFVEGDMREPLCAACFGGVVNLFTSFGYFDDEADHGRAIQAMAAALKPGGWLFQDFLNAPYVRAHLVVEDEQVIDGVRVRQERWIEEDPPGDPHVRKRITLMEESGDMHAFTESVRLLTREDFEALYAAAGLHLLHAYGDYGGAPHSPETPRLILHAVRDA